MAKTAQSTIRKRIDEVMRILIAGGELAEVKQYAQDQQWGVRTRQLKRYCHAAYLRMEKSTYRDRRQLLGRHLGVRKVLFAKSFKHGDMRTALQIVRDEAELLGLYPPTKVAPTTPDGEHPYDPNSPSAIPKRDRLVRQIRAMQNNDKMELRMLEKLTPVYLYRMSDIHQAQQTLYVQAILHANGQLETLCWFLQIMWSISDSWLPGAKENGPHSEKLDWAAKLLAYRYKTDHEAWVKYTSDLGIDGEYLLRGNYSGTALEKLGAYLLDHAPTVDELREWYASKGTNLDGLGTVEDQTKKLWKDLKHILESGNE